MAANLKLQFESTSNSSKLRTRVKGKDGFAVRALDPALKKGEVCRATDQIAITAGVPFGEPGTTNLLRIARIWPV